MFQTTNQHMFTMLYFLNCKPTIATQLPNDGCSQRQVRRLAPLVEEHQHAANGLQTRLEGALRVIRTWEGDREREKAHT